MRRLVPLLVIAVCGCGDALSVDFHLRTDASQGALHALSLEVTGNDPFPATALPIDKLSGGEGTLRYVPTAKAGAQLHFVFHVVADTSFDVALDVLLRAGHNATEVLLSSTAVNGDDLSGPADMSVHCDTAADCSAAQPVCTNHVCAGCATAADCTAFNPTLGYCAPDGSCKVCQPSLGTCESASTLKVCADDGSGLGTTPCTANDCNACTGRCGALFCEGKDKQTCDWTGAKATVKACTWQCSTADCVILLPAHFDRGSFGIANITDLIVSGVDDVVIDTTTNGNAPTVKVGAAAATTWMSYSNGADSHNVTLVVHNLTIGAGRTVRAQGVRNLLIAATGDVQIDGTLDAAAHLSVGGPGSLTMANDTNSYASGRPGGGHATPGGAGGMGGATSGMPGQGALLDTNIAGDPFSAGTAGKTPGYGGAGAGGGALQISALGAITIGATGRILASGGGGGGGSDGGMTWPPNGGGAGGSILIEAATVSIAGVVAANGGSGGGITSIGDPISGVDGQPSAVPAPAGTPAGARNIGGKGGAGTTAPTPGGVGANFGGGGGGAYGRILIRVLGALPTFLGTISPSGADAYTLGNVVTAVEP